MWKRYGKGPSYVGHYLSDHAGERVIVVMRVRKNGTVHAVTAESWQMLKADGWVKVK